MTAADKPAMHIVSIVHVACCRLTIKPSSGINVRSASMHGAPCSVSKRTGLRRTCCVQLI